jgi:LuxR family maltose regulon positive regulatory protein
MNIQGKTSKAIVLLKQAVDLAQPGRFIRVFVDLGKPMRTMLRRLARQDNSTEKIQRILAAFSEHEKKSATSSGGVSTLTESLTQREQEVLVLLQGPASIKEIAQKLNISYGTAKGHTIKIYDKLGVNRRWNAVAKAEELNILPPR